MIFRIPLYSLAMMLAVFPMQVLAIDPVLQQEQLEQARQQATLRDNRLQSRHFSAIQVHDIPVPTEESPQSGLSFWIRHVQLDMDDSSFQFLSSYTHECENKNVNVKKINQLVHDMNEELLRRGYATSRVIIPEQNIADGVLRLQVQAGRIHQVRYSEGSAQLPWRTAFPIWEGDILNVHLLEQGVEQMKKLSSQDVSLRLIPAETPGQSDIELTIHRTTPVHGILSLDDSGLTDTGRWQLSADIGIDNPFYGNDYLQSTLMAMSWPMVMNEVHGDSKSTIEFLMAKKRFPSLTVVIPIIRLYTVPPMIFSAVEKAISAVSLGTTLSAAISIARPASMSRSGNVIRIILSMTWKSPFKRCIRRRWKLACPNRYTVGPICSMAVSVIEWVWAGSVLCRKIPMMMVRRHVTICGSWM